MKKYLFISNSTKPTIEEQMSRENVVLSNVSIPCIEAAQSMGYETFMGINRINAEEIDSDYDVKFYNASSYRSLLDFKSNYIAYKNLMVLLKKEKIDVIHCNTPIGGVLGRICGRKAKVSEIIYTAHGFHFYKGAPLFNRTILKWAEMYLARYTDVIITMNSEDYNAAKKFSLHKCGNVYRVPGVGINTNDYKRNFINVIEERKNIGLTEKDIIVISIGDLIKRKNYEISIKAIAKLADERLHLLICGVGPEVDNLKKLSAKLNIEKQIHFLGFRKDIKVLLKISDIFLLTSYQEGLPRSLMEAMASGLPCIVSKVRGNVDLIVDGEGGFLVNPNNSKEISNIINLLINNIKLRKKMGENNLETVKKFDIKIVRNIIVNIYCKEL